MADIKKTLSQLMTDYADNNVGNITPQLLRNGFKTVVGSMTISAVSSNYTLVEDDIFVNVTPTTADINIVVPLASTLIEKYYIIKNSGTTYNVVVSGSVDGTSNFTVFPESTLGIESDGSTWISYIKPGVLKTGDTMTGTLKVPTLSADTIEFNRTTTETVSAGQVCWNPIDKTYDFGLEDGIVSPAFEKFLIDAYNETGTTISNGQVVYLTSGLTTDGKLHIALASNNNNSSLSTIVVATQDVLNDSRGKFTKYGKVKGFNTSTLTANQKVYLGTNGSLTSIQPSHPAYSVEIGYCTISHATSGEIYVSIENKLSIVTTTSSLSGTGTVANPLGLTSVGTAGTYNNVVVDSTGRVTSGSNTSASSGGGNLTAHSMRYTRTYSSTQDMSTSGNSQNNLYDASGRVTWVNGGYQNALSNYPGVTVMPNAISQITVGMSLMQITNLTGSTLVAGATATFRVLIVKMTANNHQVVATIPLVFTFNGANLSNNNSSNRSSECMFATAKVTGLNIAAGSLIGASYYTTSNWRVISDVMWTISYEG